MICCFGVVVPYAGTWIETVLWKGAMQNGAVVPYAGTWIETISDHRKCTIIIVVPYAGTWIKIVYSLLFGYRRYAISLLKMQIVASQCWNI